MNIHALNVGCGTDIKVNTKGTASREELDLQQFEWINLDARDLPGVDVVSDARTLPFEDGHFDFLLAQDILEHIPQEDTTTTLQEWQRVLAPGGVIEIRVPHFTRLARALATRRLQPQEFFFLFFGDQSPEAGGYVWGGHKNGWTPDGLKELLGSIGFIDTDVKEHPTEFNLYALARKPGAKGRIEFVVATERREHKYLPYR